MRNNIFAKVISEWPEASETRRIGLLQEVENYFAREEGRKSRRVVYAPHYANLNIQYAKASAFYNREEPETIYIIRFFENPMDAIIQIHHEGYHANIHDYVLGESNLEVYNDLNKSNFVKEQENFDIVISELVNMFGNDAFKFKAYSSIEEESNGYENAIVGLKIVLDLIENEDDLFKLLPYAATALEGLLRRLGEAGKVERVVNLNYEAMLNLIDIQVPNNVKTKIKQSDKKIITKKDELLLHIFNKLLSSYKKCYEKSVDMEELGMPGEIIENILQKDQMSFINEYMLAVSVWMKQKVYS
ncbi:MAG: hypothetical protein IJ538_01925 [Clostridia bacterium]|nr:hypothetical protein [Clostridia bacterium]